MLTRENAAKYLIVAWVKGWSIEAYLETIYEGRRPYDPLQISADFPWLSTGADLEHLAVLLDTERAVVDPGDPDANPPVERRMESDDRL
ncbi:hypothetical protein VPD39_07095, partial [Burkholderia vietnamiensis]|nr:hypothetical protein [Burkholderia vietnamiensis]